VATAHFTERIHDIHTQSKLYVPRILCKVWVNSIYFSPLGSISQVSQHCVLLLFFFVPSHQLSMIFVPKQTLQTWYYRRVPHDLGRNSLPRMLPLDFYRVISPDPIPQCIAYGPSKFSYSSPRYRIQSLGHACIFCTTKSRGQTSCFASYVVAGNLLSLGSIF
jgi:hypothetical protein